VVGRGSAREERSQAFVWFRIPNAKASIFKEGRQALSSVRAYANSQAESCGTGAGRGGRVDMLR
jgi:hypothetical protein